VDGPHKSGHDVLGWPMMCFLCMATETHSDTTTVMVERGRTIVIVKEVPAQVCDNCGEYYLDSDIASRASTLVENAVKNGAEVEIIRFAA